MSLDYRGKDMRERHVSFLGSKDSMETMAGVLDEVQRRMNFSTMGDIPPEGIKIPDDDLSKVLSYKLTKRAFQQLSSFLSKEETVSSTTINLGGNVIEYPSSERPDYLRKMQKRYQVIQNLFSENNPFDGNDLYVKNMSRNPFSAIEDIVYVDSLNVHIPPDKGIPPVFVYNGVEYNAGYVLVYRLRDGENVDFNKEIKIDKKTYKTLKKLVKDYLDRKLTNLHNVKSYLKYASLSMAPYLALTDAVAGDVQTAKFKDDKGVSHLYALIPVYGNTNTTQDFIKPIQVAEGVSGMIDDIIDVS